MNVEDLNQNERKRSSQGEGSEEQVPLDRLVKHGEWDQLKDNTEYQKMSLKGKIIKAKEAVNVRLAGAIQTYTEVVRDEPAEGGILYKEELVPLRNLLKALNKRYVGEVKPQDAPEEMTDILRIPATNPQHKKAA